MKKREMDPYLDNDTLYHNLSKQLFNIKDALLERDSNKQSLILALEQNLALISKKIEEMQADVNANQEYIDIVEKIDKHIKNNNLPVSVTLILVINALFWGMIFYLIIKSTWIGGIIKFLGIIFSAFAFAATSAFEIFFTEYHKKFKIACQEYCISRKEYWHGLKKVYEKEQISKFKILQQNYEEMLKIYGKIEELEENKLDIFFDQISQALHKASSLEDANKRTDYTTKLMALNEYYQQKLLKICGQNNAFAETELKNLLIEKVAIIEFAMEQDLKVEQERNKIKRDANIIREQGVSVMTMPKHIRTRTKEKTEIFDKN